MSLKNQTHYPHWCAEIADWFGLSERRFRKTNPLLNRFIGQPRMPMVREAASGDVKNAKRTQSCDERIAVADVLCLEKFHRVAHSRQKPRNRKNGILVDRKKI